MNTSALYNTPYSCRRSSCINVVLEKRESLQQRCQICTSVFREGFDVIAILCPVEPRRLWCEPSDGRSGSSLYCRHALAQRAECRANYNRARRQELCSFLPVLGPCWCKGRPRSVRRRVLRRHLHRVGFAGCVTSAATDGTAG